MLDDGSARFESHRFNDVGSALHELFSKRALGDSSVHYELYAKLGQYELYNRRALDDNSAQAEFDADFIDFVHHEPFGKHFVDGDPFQDELYDDGDVVQNERELVTNCILEDDPVQFGTCKFNDADVAQYELYGQRSPFGDCVRYELHFGLVTRRRRWRSGSPWEVVMCRAEYTGCANDHYSDGYSDGGEITHDQMFKFGLVGPSQGFQVHSFCCPATFRLFSCLTRLGKPSFCAEG